MAQIQFDVVTPKALLRSEEAHMVVIPGEEGEFGVLHNHAPLISNLRNGVVTIYQDANTPSARIFVAGGFAEVTGERCTVLAEEALDLAEVKRSDVEDRLEAAKKALQKAAPGYASTKAEKDIAVAEALLAVLRDA